MGLFLCFVAFGDGSHRRQLDCHIFIQAYRFVADGGNVERSCWLRQRNDCLCVGESGSRGVGIFDVAVSLFNPLAMVVCPFHQYMAIHQMVFGFKDQTLTHPFKCHGIFSPHLRDGWKRSLACSCYHLSYPLKQQYSVVTRSIYIFFLNNKYKLYIDSDIYFLHLFLATKKKQIKSSACPLQIRHGSFDRSPLVDQIDASKLPQIEIVRNPPEWKFVEQLLPAATVPIPTIKKEYPSGWRPQTIDPSQTKYFIRRNKSHMVPVHLSITFRGTRRVTELQKIEGDIWALAEELRDFLEDYTDRKMAIRVQEFSGQIWIKGDYVNLIKDYLVDKGFQKSILSVQLYIKMFVYSFK